MTTRATAKMKHLYPQGIERGVPALAACGETHTPSSMITEGNATAVVVCGKCWLIDYQRREEAVQVLGDLLEATTNVADLCITKLFEKAEWAEQDAEYMKKFDELMTILETTIAKGKNL